MPRENTEVFGRSWRRKQKRRKLLMNQGFVVSAVVMSFRSQVHLLREGFNNRRVCAPKS